MSASPVPRSRRTVLMGDPEHFSVKGGANPHTRTRWGTRRQVDRALAVRQWRKLRDVLRDLDVCVLVVPPDPAQPGLVYPANAGFQSDVDAEQPCSEKVFTLANLLPSRAGEKPHYARVLSQAGFCTRELDASLRFEGEADFFPAGDLSLLTHGRIERQRFVPAWGWPPWRRIYGFRTDVRVAEVLAPRIAPRKILKVGLVLEAHYHGDTALCAFGPGRRQLLAYRRAIHPEDWPALATHFGDALIELSEQDARLYAANSFTHTPAGGGDSTLLMPSGVSPRLQDQIREHGAKPLLVDVSEFLKKGGGSVKCMIGDLGLVAEAPAAAIEASNRRISCG